MNANETNMEAVILTPPQVMNQYYLNARHELLEVAATLDRLDRAAIAHPEWADTGDPRVELIKEAILLLSEYTNMPNRAERMLEIFGKMRKE